MKKKLSGMMTSKVSVYETPMDLFAKQNARFDFTIDLAATQRNTLCPTFFSKKDNALEQSWTGHRGWLNPPYGRDIGKWFKKAFEETRDGITVVVMLVPCRTDTAYWHDYAMKAEEIHYLRGRLKFTINGKPIRDKKGRPVGAPFPSAIIVFGEHK